MNDRGLKVLEQYDLKVAATRRGRGSYICETDKGKKLLTEFSGSAKRLAFQNKVLALLKENGVSNVDYILENMEGNLVSYDRDENGYVVKDWFEGKEFDTKNEEDIAIAIKNLAMIHKVMRMEGTDEDMVYQGGDLAAELERHNQELKKVRAFMRSRRGKNAFESKFLESFPVFFEQAEDSVRRIKESSYEKLRQESLKKGQLVHGSYNQHQILIGRDGVATTNFDKCRYDIPVTDLYQFLRKILEKQDWNIALGMKMLGEYGSVRRISDMEMEHLMLRLYYPEKFWKLANQYYNMNKAWIPQKNVEKLDILMKQQDQRNCFLKILE